MSSETARPRAATIHDVARAAGLSRGTVSRVINDRVAEYLRGGFVDGVVIISAREGDPIGRAVATMGIPAAFVGHPPGLDGIAYIGIDNVGAARAITERLLATGRTRVGMIASALDRDSGRDRLAGFTEAMGDRFDPELVVDFPLYSYSSG
ncbi:LacI family DNA-binding transcriptional regulator, partial [Streptomyces bacillaris]|uniref:LacI family DNA-binding transcriptional regulator n=1 Tax=Streptomyces bacillaris TaxID=68179 RepID=UPI0036DF7946